MKIPVHSQTIRRKEMDAVLTCLVSEKLGPGEFYQRLTQQARELLEMDGAAAFRSPSIALVYLLRALDIPSGSGIIMSALAPSWQYRTVVDNGYRPLVADVYPESAVVDLDSVETAIKNGGRLLILHEPLGYLPDVQQYKSFDIPIIEDISASVGAYNGEIRAGLAGTFAILGLEDRDLVAGGGGAILLSALKRESVVLKKFADEAPLTDILTDFNAALAYVQLKELARNMEARKDIHSMYVRSLMQGRHKTLAQQGEGSPSCYSFPVLLSSGLKEVRQYASRKDIEIEPAFTGSIADYLGESLEGCLQAKSLLMRCVLFPLYPRLGNANAVKIAKVLATLP